MLNYSSIAPVVSTFLVLCFVSFGTPSYANPQSCTPVENFEASQYNTVKASYSWDLAQDALFYILEIRINEEFYMITDLPGNSTAFSVEFDPKLKHHDKVSAKLTKNCKYGESTTSTFDFVIVTDIVVYLTGGPQNGDPDTVEPVFGLNDNLIPNGGVCGLCDPGFFRLTSGFYGPYDIGLDASIPYTIEQLRFVKSELCGCLDKAVDEGLLDANGGPGPNYEGEPFNCKIIPYVFTKTDCERGKEGEERNNGKITTSFRAIPNPVTTTTQISFELTQNQNVSLSVFDFTGRLIAQPLQAVDMPEGQYQSGLNTENWPAGLYQCVLTVGEEVSTIKLVK
jgi:Secretion system C-terminal sorting domain